MSLAKGLLRMRWQILVKKLFSGHAGIPLGLPLSISHFSWVLSKLLISTQKEKKITHTSFFPFFWAPIKSVSNKWHKSLIWQKCELWQAAVCSLRNLYSVPTTCLFCLWKQTTPGSCQDASIFNPHSTLWKRTWSTWEHKASLNTEFKRIAQFGTGSGCSGT